jgi:mono/diheme cytochrome c family protein
MNERKGFGMGKHRLLVVATAALPLLAVACASMSYRDAPSAYSGAELYETFCASCHGERADGHGPVTPFLKVHVPELRHIAARRGGQFPEDEIYRIIDGQSQSLAHGARHMPVWGYEFFGDEADDETAHRDADRTIRRLVKYLESIQRPAGQ